MKKILLLLSFLFCLVPSYVDAATVPNVDSSKKIYDYANLFTLEEENILYDKVSDYIDSSNYDMVIVTVSDNYSSPSSYADDFYDYNNFGYDDNYSGILYLIDLSNREIFISTTGDAISLYDDRWVNNTLDDLYDYASLNDFYGSAVSFIEESDYYYHSGGVVKKEVNWLLSIIVALIVPSVVVWIMISSHKKIKLAITADDYVDRKATKIGVAKDSFLNKNVSKVYIQPVSSSGGSTTRVGSSGRSHGGGGRKF